jgi:DNA repair exonuclease SbcCD ATPase subunit
VDQDLQNLKIKIEILKAKKEELLLTEAELTKKLKTVRSLNFELENAILLAKACLEDFLKRRIYIEDLVSKALTSVFGVEYKFLLELQYDSEDIIKGIKPRLSVQGGEFDDPLDSFGGGVQAVTSLCFRIAILLLNSQTAELLVMDEPLANLSASLQPTIQAFIEETCRVTGLQLIMVTHQDEPFGKVYKIEKRKGISKCVI